MNKKKALLWSLGVVLAGVGAVVVWAAMSPAIPAPANQTPEEVVKYIVSAEFQEVTEEEEDDYFQAAATRFDNPAEAMAAFSDLNDEERQRLRQHSGSLIRHVMSRQAKVFFELPLEERDAHLDKIIDVMMGQRQAMMKRRAERPPRPDAKERTENAADRGNADPPPPPRRGGWGRGRGFSLERYKWMVENIPPEDLARFIEFGKAMAKRMAERAAQRRAGETQD